MSIESNPSQPRTFHESVRMLHGFLHDRPDNGDIDMGEIDNFSQRERLTFGHCQENGNQRGPHLHLELLERLGAIEIIEKDETKLIRLVDKEKLP